jgi:hypothetical protein
MAIGVEKTGQQVANDLDAMAAESLKIKTEAEAHSIANHFIYLGAEDIRQLISSKSHDPRRSLSRRHTVPDIAEMFSQGHLYSKPPRNGSLRRIHL